jgi:ethanolamine utilization cobalamin adenosyltransferase
MMSNLDKHDTVVIMQLILRLYVDSHNTYILESLSQLLKCIQNIMYPEKAFRPLFNINAYISV